MTESVSARTKSKSCSTTGTFSSFAEWDEGDLGCRADRVTTADVDGDGFSEIVIAYYVDAASTLEYIVIDPGDET